MPREVIDPGPFRFTEIHGSHRARDEQFQVGRLLRLRGAEPPRCEFALEEIPLIQLIESMVVESHLERGLQEAGVFDYEAWRANGAQDAPLCDLYAKIDESRRINTPQFTPRLVKLEALYASGAAVDPLVAMEREFALSSGDNALILVDGRHRTFAATRANVDRVPVFVLTRSDAVFSY